MKKTNMIIFAASIAALMGCGAAPSATNNANTANVNAAAAPKAPAADVPMVAAPKLLEMVAKDVEGVNDQFKGREMIVIGEVDDAMTGLRFVGGFNQKIYCDLSSTELDEKKEKIRQLAEAYLMKRRPTMPIVEARGVFDKASVSQFTAPYKGTDVSVFLVKCAIVSVKE